MRLLRRAFTNPLPHFPGQQNIKYLSEDLSAENIEERRVKLQQYMRELICNPCAVNSNYFPEFICLPHTKRSSWRILQGKLCNIL